MSRSMLGVEYRLSQVVYDSAVRLAAPSLARLARVWVLTTALSVVAVLSLSASLPLAIDARVARDVPESRGERRLLEVDEPSESMCLSEENAFEERMCVTSSKALSSIGA